MMSFYLFGLSMAIISAFIPPCFTVIWRLPAAALTLASQSLPDGRSYVYYVVLLIRNIKFCWNPQNDVSYNGDESVDCIMMQSWKKKNPIQRQMSKKKVFLKCKKVHFQTKLRGRKRKCVVYSVHVRKC